MSLESILTEQEYQQVEDKDSLLAPSATSELKDILHVLNLSIVPNFDGSIHAKDKVKKQSFELRKLPPIELTIALVKAYPSHKAPIMALKTPFY